MSASILQPKKILVVEDSAVVAKIVRHVINQDDSIEAWYAASMAEAQKLVAEHQSEIFAALADLNLPDAPDGEVVDFLLQQGIPTVVLTGSFDEERRSKVLSKGVVDYVTKEGRYSYRYAVNLVNRLHKNQQIKVLVVEDSDTSRRYICELLRLHKYQVLEASDGMQAIRVLLDNPEIKLLITDYNMPKMDGFELVKNIRHKYEKSDLIIIGLSAEGNDSLSAKFIKNGANDFLQKPFNHEEFHCRVAHNVESLELIERIREAAYRDDLTGAYNRRYFFEAGLELYQQASQQNAPLAAVVIDIDHFKQLNDQYGHALGDYALQVFASVLSNTLGRFLVARTGGEEFFALLPGLDNEKAIALLNRVREIVATTPIEVEEEDLFLSFSAGVTNQLCDSLDEQLSLADGYLYRAKEAGRDMVVGDDDSDYEG